MQKFIITNEGRLKFGDVRLHRDLLAPGESCLGGGFYEFDYPASRMMLSGKSYDFGRVKWSLIDTVILPPSLQGLTILYEDLPLSDFAPITFA